jgi:CubicO group peptidase (beta-lactamase class C family)
LDAEILRQIDPYLKQNRHRLVNSILVVRNGKIVWEAYFNRFNENSRHQIKSIWKSILAVVTGICLDKGWIRSLDEPVADYIPEFARNIDPYHKLITIRHLMTMTSGIYWNGGVHYHCPMISQMVRTKDWTAHLADIEMAYPPGTHHQYKEWDVMLLSTVIGKACEGTAYEVAKSFLFEPLDIQSGEWPNSPCGFSYTVTKGEERSNLSARDLAKLGLLFMQKGVFDGRRIVSAEFVEQAHFPSIPSVDPDATGPSHGTKSAYGWLWWIFPEGYGCRGYGGQEINVLPERNMISVIQATATRNNKSYGEIHREYIRKAIL